MIVIGVFVWLYQTEPVKDVPEPASNSLQWKRLASNSLHPQEVSFRSFPGNGTGEGHTEATFVMSDPLGRFGEDIVVEPDQPACVVFVRSDNRLGMAVLKSLCVAEPPVRTIVVFGNEEHPDWSTMDWSRMDWLDARSFKMRHQNFRPSHHPWSCRIRRAKEVERLIQGTGIEIGFTENRTEDLNSPLYPINHVTLPAIRLADPVAPAAILSADRTRWLTGKEEARCDEDVRLLIWLLTNMGFGNRIN